LNGDPGGPTKDRELGEPEEDKKGNKRGGMERGGEKEGRGEK